MIKQYSITATSWVQITSVGASAMVWKDEQSDGIVGAADVVVVNSPTTPAQNAVEYGRVIYRPNGMLEGHELVPDSLTDIFWARCRTVGAQAVVTVAGPYGKTVAVHPNHTEPDGAVRVQIQDNQSELVGLKICQFLNSITLTSTATIDTYIVNVAAGHGFIAGNVMCLRENGRFYQATVLSVATNAITLDTPLDYTFTTAAVGFRSQDNMAVNGSVTPVTFKISPPGGTKWDVLGCSFHIVDDTAMDDAKFGGITALTRGLVTRKKDGTYKNIFNIKTNGDFSFRCDEVKYADKAPSGYYGFNAKKTFSIRHGIVIRLDADKGDEFQVIVQDDLTGLTSLKAAAWGHVVS